jgi:hypothetical protein
VSALLTSSLEGSVISDPDDIGSPIFVHRVMTMLIPVAFFASLDDGSATSTVTSTLVRREGSVAPPLIAVSDASRDVFLKLSRGLSIILLIM